MGQVESQALVGGIHQGETPGYAASAHSIGKHWAALPMPPGGAGKDSSGQAQGASLSYQNPLGRAEGNGSRHTSNAETETQEGSVGAWEEPTA